MYTLSVDMYIRSKKYMIRSLQLANNSPSKGFSSSLIDKVSLDTISGKNTTFKHKYS